MDVETCPNLSFSTINIEQNFEEMSDAFVLGDTDKMSECMTFVNECITHWRDGRLLRNIDYEDLLHNARVVHQVLPATPKEVEKAKAHLAFILRDLSLSDVSTLPNQPAGLARSLVVPQHRPIEGNVGFCTLPITDVAKLNTKTHHASTPAWEVKPHKGRGATTNRPHVESGIEAMSLIEEAQRAAKEAEKVSTKGNLTMIRDSAEHEAHKQAVLKQFEDAAVAKFTALIPTFTDNIPATLDALTDLQSVRGLTQREKGIMALLLQLEMCRTALSCFTPEAHALRQRRTV